MWIKSRDLCCIMNHRILSIHIGTILKSDRITPFFLILKRIICFIKQSKMKSKLDKKQRNYERSVLIVHY